jgi:hypothetical protein
MPQRVEYPVSRWTYESIQRLFNISISWAGVLLMLMGHAAVSEPIASLTSAGGPIANPMPEVPPITPTR